jgi:hypothetical protein
MKKTIKWFGIFAVLTLFIVCIDINLNRLNISPTNEDQVRIINLVTVGVLIFIIIRFIMVRKLKKK